MKKPGNLPGFFCLGVYEGRKLEVRSLKQGIIRITYETRSIQINSADMDIDHVAIWTKDLEKEKDFYLNFFG